HWRQCPERHPRGNRAQILQGLGDGLLQRLPQCTRGGQAHGAARTRHHPLHWRNRLVARQRGLRRICRREACVARLGAKHGARAGAEEHPRGARGGRWRDRHGVHQLDLPGAVRHEGAGRHLEPRAHRRELLVPAPATARRLDVRARPTPLYRTLVSGPRIGPERAYLNSPFSVSLSTSFGFVGAEAASARGGGAPSFAPIDSASFSLSVFRTAASATPDHWIFQSMASNGPDNATGTSIPRNASSPVPPWPTAVGVSLARAV